MESVFISYRSADDVYAAALLDQMLSQAFGRNNVFRASRSITPGSDYASALLTAVDASKVMVVVVGPGWQRSTEPGGRALFRTEDWVHKEILRALEVEIPIIPVLLSGAPRLADIEIPHAVRRFTSLQYLRFDYRNIENDFLRIKLEVSRYVPEAEETRRVGIADQLRELADEVEKLK